MGALKTGGRVGTSYQSSASADQRMTTFGNRTHVTPSPTVQSAPGRCFGHATSDKRDTMNYRPKHIAAGLLSVAMMLGACTDSGSSTSAPFSEPSSAPTSVSMSSPGSSISNLDQPNGQPSRTGSSNDGSSAEVALNIATPRLFAVKLSTGKLGSETATTNAVVAGDSVSAQRQRELIAKLPAWDDPLSLTTPFAWPKQAPPPPRTGKTVDQQFPPTVIADTPIVDNGPLKVLRVQPEGDVPIAPYFAITFNQPMVAVGTVAQVSASNVPVKLDPPMGGTWQWIGTRTLRFDANSKLVDRLPMATTFTATVPAGTRSVAGGTLAATQTVTFTTPPPTVLSFGPSDVALPLEPVFVATFDQRVDQAAVLPSIKLLANGEPQVVRLATNAEVAADEIASSTTSNSQDGRWIAFRPVTPLAKDAALRIDLGAGLPSAEGPRRSEQLTTYTARTYGPLRVMRTTCNYGDECPPGTGLWVEFSNPLDPKAPANVAARVGVTPTLPAQKVSITNAVLVEGATRARTEYQVALPAGLTDIYGQTLGNEEIAKFKIGAARRSLRQLDLITTLDPFIKAQKLSVLSTNNRNLRVRVYEADPGQFKTFSDFFQRRFDPNATQPRWKVLSDRKVKVSGDDDATNETLIDLANELKGAPGQVIVRVDVDPAPKQNSAEFYENQPVITWVQSTTIGLDAFTDAKNMRVWATDLRTGAPINGLTVATLQGAASTTDANGLAVFGLVEKGQVDFVRGVRGSESFILPVSAVAQPITNSISWFAFDDRAIYKPGETVSIKGWAREVDGDTGALSVRVLKSGRYTMNDAFGNEIGAGSFTFGNLGGFDLQVKVPLTANLGEASVVLIADGANQYQHSFQIAEFRRPEFEVDVQPVTSGPFFSNKSVTTAAKASYYSGGPLPGAPVQWSVSTSETSFSPAGWDSYTFGIFRPWWWGDEVFSRTPPIRNEQTVKTYSGTTDDDGRHGLQLDFVGENGKLPDLPVSVSVSGTVTDVNRQAWSDQNTLLVHSADRYVGLRSDRTFVRAGDPMKVEVVVTDIDGQPQLGSAVTLTAGLLRTDYVDGKLVEEVVDPQTCDVKSATDAQLCVFRTPFGGQYRVSTTVAGVRGGKNRTELSVWVSGGSTQPARVVELEALTLVPDRQRYAPGDTAKVLVQAPFVGGEGLLVLTHGSGVRETYRFTATDGSAEVEVAITEADIPSISATVEVVGKSTRVGFDGVAVSGAPPRPAYASGTLLLSVPPLSRTLTVTAKPAQSDVVPGGKTSIDVTVRDATGAPVKDSEFAVVVVDEAVLGLTNYQLANPIDVFYGGGYNSLSTLFGRDQVRLVDPETIVGAGPAAPAPVEEAAAAAEGESFDSVSKDLAAGAPAPSAALKRSTANDAGSQASPVAVRSNFDALALFRPTVMTDAAGKATIDVTVPDNLTRYRVMVVAVSGNDRFGIAESNITARLPLSIRPSAPRFLNIGDRFELPVVIQNLDSKPTTVEVLVQVANLTSEGPLAKTVSIPANDRVEVRFAISVKQPGTAKVRVSGFSQTASDSAEVSVPVFTPGTAEAFATYGTIDTGAVRQPVLAPTEVIDAFGGLEVSTSSTSLQALTDALLYVSEYDYQSSDAYASRIMAIGALRKVLRDFETADLPSEASLNATVEADVKSLVGLQNDDGGWSYWRRYDRSEPYNTVQATHALVLAREAGYAVDENAIQRALQYVANIEQFIPAEYGETYRDTVRAYAIWVKALAGQRDPFKAATLYAERGDKLNLDALAWVWGSLDAPASKQGVERTITNRAVDTAGAVSFASGYTDDDYLTLGSDQRTDAIVLDALIANSPQSDLVEKVVAGLLAHRVKGRWNNAQENTFVLLALKRYYDTYESVTPDFIAKAWLGQQFAGQQTFKGRSTDRNRINIPMTELIKGGNRDLVLQKDGSGRLYYRIGLKYVPADLSLDPLDRGFVVKRTYEAVDNPSDVKQNADGSWNVKAGAKVRVRLTMVAESQRTFVALVDPLPAGFEALNPDLAVTQPVQGDPAAPAKQFWWWGNWYAHQQFRDDRIEAFTTYLSAGVYDYSYVARATTPGAFVVPPTRAEEMYSPETFGRAGTDRVIIQ